MAFTDKWSNFAEYAETNGVVIKCAWCGEEFTPKSANQKYHRRNSDDYDDMDAAWCEDERWLATMPKDRWIRLTQQITPKEYITKYGVESYNAL